MRALKVSSSVALTINIDYFESLAYPERLRRDSLRCLSKLFKPAPAMFYAIFLIGLLYLAIVSPAFRAVIIIFILVAGAGIWLLISNEASERAKREAERQRSDAASAVAAAQYNRQQEIKWARIKPAEVELRDINFRSVARDDFDVTASIKNNAAIFLTGIELNFTINDCYVDEQQAAPLDIRPTAKKQNPLSPAEKCEIIGQTKSTLYPSIPAQQVRRIEDRLVFTNLPQPRGNVKWKVTINRVRGDDAPTDLLSDYQSTP